MAVVDPVEGLEVPLEPEVEARSGGVVQAHRRVGGRGRAEVGEHPGAARNRLPGPGARHVVGPRVQVGGERRLRGLEHLVVSAGGEAQAGAVGGPPRQGEAGGEPRGVAPAPEGGPEAGAQVDVLAGPEGGGPVARQRQRPPLPPEIDRGIGRMGGGEIGAVPVQGRAVGELHPFDLRREVEGDPDPVGPRAVGDGPVRHRQPGVEPAGCGRQQRPAPPEVGAVPDDGRPVAPGGPASRPFVVEEDRLPVDEAGDGQPIPARGGQVHPREGFPVAVGHPPVEKPVRGGAVRAAAADEVGDLPRRAAGPEPGAQQVQMPRGGDVLVAAARPEIEDVGEPSVVRQGGPAGVQPSGPDDARGHGVHQPSEVVGRVHRGAVQEDLLEVRRAAPHEEHAPGLRGGTGAEPVEGPGQARGAGPGAQGAEPGVAGPGAERVLPLAGRVRDEEEALPPRDQRGQRDRGGPEDRVQDHLAAGGHPHARLEGLVAEGRDGEPPPSRRHRVEPVAAVAAGERPLCLAAALALDPDQRRRHGPATGRAEDAAGDRSRQGVRRRRVVPGGGSGRGGRPGGDEREEPPGEGGRDREPVSCARHGVESTSYRSPASTGT